MKHNRRRSPHSSRRSPSVLDRIQVDVAGIDCGATEHYVSVPPDRDPTLSKRSGPSPPTSTASPTGSSPVA